MMHLRSSRALFRSMLRRFRRSETGTMSVEMVLVLPMLTLWFAASFVFFDVFRVSYVNEKSAYTVADLISRQTTTLTDNDIDGMNKIFDFLIDDRALTWLRVTSISYVAADPVAGTPEGYVVLWSSATRGRERWTTLKFVGSEAEQHIPLMSVGESVILTETFARYIPPLTGFIAEQNLTTFIPTRPRFVSQILYTPPAGS